VRLNHGRPGAKDGPRAFREALAKYGVAQPFGWEWPAIFDAGDVVPAKGTGVAALTATHQRVTEAVKAILDLGLFPIGIGGGHDLTYPFVRGVIEWYVANRKPNADRRGNGQGRPEHAERFRGIYFDAHLDVRETPGSGMPFRELVEECGVDGLTVHGLNPFSNSRAHVEWFLDNGGSFGEDDEIGEPHPRHPTFVSFDMDVLDASCTPGVSAVNPAGWSTGLAEAWVDALGAEPNVRCFDLMEFNPVHDVDGRTARVAVHLFLSFLHGFARRSVKGGRR
jgi:formiminoglutamase